MIRRNNLCVDVAWHSINHAGEQLCGDHVELVAEDENSTAVVLADGLGSGVKASILSTLTAKILSTMVANGMKPEDAVETIAATLPVCSVRGVAYSTFTVIRIVNNQRAEIIQYDNPRVIHVRDGVPQELPVTKARIAEKDIYFSDVILAENDVFIAMSDGVEHAGVGLTYNFGWCRDDITDFILPYVKAGYTAKGLSTVLVEECNSLYEGKPGDDATVCTVRIRQREPMNVIIGPPSDRNDCGKMLSLFFAKEGKRIVCGGSTSNMVAEYLKKPLHPVLDFPDPEIPPIAELEGVDLVTEGVITINRVLEYAKDYLDQNQKYAVWSVRDDGASRIARMLFEEATDINFFVGRAVNPAHQNPNLPIHFNIKMRLVDELATCLGKMGKHIKVSYF